ncbi:MAG: peroxiredoxin [Aigarchaeota archaeon]|nr:peroxiredoxin [Aigarchaeota archaeon]MDW8092299.1 peroxiredoxin [Nitrososphaerota archaeon]
MRVGELAPNFSLPDHENRVRSLRDLLENKKFLILYFYPKDDTPGCTKEACGFRDLLNEIRGMNGDVVGISVDDARSHQSFSKKYSLGFTLLTDSKGEVARLFDSFSEEKGRCLRKTFVIDEKGRVIGAFEEIKAEDHPLRALEYVKEKIGRG